jgi:glycosyltransferase involved in cell wall biosynthesis
MRQCESFAKIGNEVILLRPYRANHIKEDAFDYYGISRNFSILTMNSIDFYFALGRFGFFCSRLSQMIVGTFMIMRMSKEIDIIYTRDPWMIVLSLFLDVNKKIVYEAHKTYGSLLSRYVVERADLTICITKSLREFYTLFVKKKDIIVEPSGVDLTQFQTQCSQQQLREKFGIPISKKVLGYVGRYTTMGEEKGVSDVVRAFAAVHLKCPDSFLLIAGLEDHEIDSLRLTCLALGLAEEDFLLLPLVQKDFASYVQVSDFLIMNYPNTEHYRYYMSPTKLFAYLGSSRAVIASDLPSIREIVDESMVHFINPDDRESLEGAIAQVYLERIPTAPMIENALLHVQKFTWDSRSKRILEALQGAS